MKLNVVSFPVRMFDYNPVTRSYVAEASDMGNRHLQPLDDSNRDVGFIIEFDNDQQCTYVMTKVLTTGIGDDREITGWEYRPTLDDVCKVPSCHHTKAIIFND